MTSRTDNLSRNQDASAAEERPTADVTENDVELRLEQLLKENTALRRDLARAQAEARDAAQVKHEFMGRMSHEIRTPMNAVIGMARLALRTELTEKQQHYLEKIQDAAQTLLGIFSDLLDFTRIENQSLALAPRSFLLQELLEGLAQEYGPRAEDKGLGFVFSIDENVPAHLVGDRQRLAQALGLLVDNAVKFTHSGSIAIAVELLEKDRRRARVRFSVTDTGIGLDQRQQQDIFALFTQADTSFARSYGGMGIGLALCRRLVEMMGGEIAVESERGKGSTFFFSLEFAFAEDVPFSRDIFADKRILLVVKDSGLRTHYLDYFKNMPCQCLSVTTCAEAEEAIAAAGANAPFHALLVDDALPDGTGSACVHRLASHAAAPFPPRIVLLSESGAGGTVSSASDCIVLPRPATRAAVLGALGGALSQAEKNRLQDEDVVAWTLAGRRVLLVEDNPINQEVASELLQGWDIEVDVAHDGEMALTMVEQARYDAVLMDVQMPGMDGLEATRRMRTLACCGHLPIIAVTAHALDEDRQHCLDAGMDDYLSKPIDPDLLHMVLLRWITPGFALGGEEEGEGRQEHREGEDRSRARESGAKEQDILADRGPAAPRTESSADMATVSASDHPVDATVQDKGAVLHLDAALNYLGGDTALLDDMLHDFIGHCPAIADRLLRALGRDDRVTARRLTRTLRGLGSLFGVVGLYRAVKDLESWLETSPPDGQASELDVGQEFGIIDRLRREVTVAVAAAEEVLARLASSHDDAVPGAQPTSGADRQGGASPGVEASASPHVCKIPGLDLVSALNMLGGNRKLLCKICREFDELYEQAGEDLRKRLSVGDVDGARRLAHTVKGIAGNLGARQLAGAAWDLETALAQQRNVPPQLIETFEGALAKALYGVRKFQDRELGPTVCSEPTALPPLKVLFVDDARINQTVFSDLLTEKGFLVETAGNGKEACLRLFASEDDARPFDLIILDLEMPEMDGFKTAQTIRKVLASSSRPTLRQKVPIIALTAHDVEQEMERCLAAGMDDCVQKSFDPTELLEAIDRTYRYRIQSELSRFASSKKARVLSQQSDQSETLDRERLAQVLGELSAMLQRSNIAAEDQLQILKTLLTATRWESDLRRIEKYMDQFDFQAAYACVQALEQGLGFGRKA